MCFSLDWLKAILIWAIIIVAIIGILQLVIPYVIRRLGVAMGEGWAVIVGALRIVLWAVITIVVVIVCFELITCLISFAGGFPSLMPHR